MRRRKPLPTYAVNGWTIAKRPNSFGERFVYVATAVDAEGYQTAFHGFATLRDAKTFCETNSPPKERTRERTCDD